MISLSTFRKLVIGAALIAAPAASFASVFISVGFAPPVLPVYTQPLCPGDGYLWTPGYWAYAPDGGYYWVPGVWVQPPTVGFLWTPPYWGFAGGVYGFHEGYWGPHVGFYGGVNYGFGYGGVGFGGGRWEGGHFAYNTAVMNVGPGFHNVYNDRTVIVNNNFSHASYNGGPGGIQARPRPEELQAEREHHVAPTSTQQNHFQSAAQNRSNFATANGGHPQMAAIQRPGVTQGAVPARGAQPVAQANRGGFQQGAQATRGAQPAAQTTRGGFQGAQANRTAQPTAQQGAQANRGGFGNTAAARPQAQQQTAARPQMQPAARPAAPQARAAAAPRAQAAPRAAAAPRGGGGEEHHK